MVKCCVPGCNNPGTIDIAGQPYCQYHASIIKGGISNIDRSEPVLIPVLIWQRSPLAHFITRTDGTREAFIPLGLSSGGTTESSPEIEKEVDWNTLVGAEPIDELKTNKDMVLAAEFVEREGETTAKRLAKYLSSHPYSSMYGKSPDDDKARDLLDKLTELGIVKKKRRAGRRGANIYSYLEGSRSWQKETA